MKKAKILFLFFNVFIFCNIYSHSLVKNFFFELMRYEVTGVSNDENIKQYAGINKTAFLLMTLPKWTFDNGPVYIFELLDSSFTGEIDVSYENPIDKNYVEEFYAAKNNSSYDFSVKTPDLLNSDLSKITEDDKILDDVKNLVESANSSSIERRIFDSEQNLSLFSFNDEILAIQKRDNKNILVSSDDKKTIRRFFDEKSRVYKKEIWDISGSFQNSYLKNEELYFYDEEKTVPSSATLLEENFKYKLTYNETGKVVASEKYEYIPDTKAAENEQETKKSNVLDKGDNYILRSKTNWKYNDEGKIIEKLFSEYEYKKVNKTKKTLASTKKDVYEYKIKDVMPDYYYYENDVLRMKTIYSNEDSYVTTFYFDGGFVVDSVYENATHTKDIFYSNGNIIRQKVYE